LRLRKLFTRGGKKAARPDGWQSPELIVVGLGNPGARYRNTRHNVGWWCLEELARRSGIGIGHGNRHTDLGEGYLRGIQITLARPLTFMNKSGDAVSYLLRRYNATPRQLVVLADDMALPPGKLRVRPGGGAGGHNGLKSIISVTGANDFARVRIGIGRPFDRGDEIDHVLTTFPPDELEHVREAIARAADAVETLATEGVDHAMNVFN
jgi:PTH1 family peptidyl-tRNA hydrolase